MRGRDEMEMEMEMEMRSQVEMAEDLPLSPAPDNRR
jgi:hypothetical protein